MRRAVAIAILAIGCLAAAAPALAKPLQYTFTLEVTSFDDVLNEAFPTLAIGDVISGGFTVDTDAVPTFVYDFEPTGKQGVYYFFKVLPDGPAPFYIDFKGQRLEWSQLRIEIYDNLPPDSYDNFLVSPDFPAPTSLVLDSSFIFQLASIGLWDGIGLPISELTSVDIFDYQQADHTVVWGLESGGLVSYRVTSLQPVPEPGTLMITGLGVVGLGVWARRRGSR